MADLYIGMAVMAAISIGGFFLAAWLTEKLPRFGSESLAFLTVIAVVAYIKYVWHRPVLFELLPFSNLVIVGNWFLPAAGFLAGLVWKRVSGPAYRKAVFVIPLVVVGSYSVVHPLRGSPPECENKWISDNICQQTTKYTCSPACAVTLLKAHGIAATEQEMARLCLTRKGTTWQGLFRGLKRKTAGTKWDVDAFQCDRKELRRLLWQTRGPIIISVELKEELRNDVYEDRKGWIPGQPHAVLLYGFMGREYLVIGDPTIGREPWHLTDLNVLWHGKGMRLVEAESNRSPLVTFFGRSWE